MYFNQNFSQDREIFVKEHQLIPTFTLLKFKITGQQLEKEMTENLEQETGYAHTERDGRVLRGTKEIPTQLFPTQFIQL